MEQIKMKERSKFEQDLIELILKSNEENLERLRKGFPELVEEFRGNGRK